MLGPGIMLTSTPIAFGVASFACARGIGRSYAVPALVLSGMEALFLPWAIVSMVVSAVN